MSTTVLARGTGLAWEPRVDGAARIDLGAPGARALWCRVEAGRLRVAMEVATGRPVDISVQPGLAIHLLDAAARRHDTDPRGLLGQVAAHIRDLLAAARAPHAPLLDRLAPDATLFAACYPLSAPALAAGTSPIREVPRWAVAALSHPDARAALAEVVGVAGTNRRGARNLVASLAPPDPTTPQATLALFPLAMVAMGAAVLDADRVANVLELTDPFRPEAEWPSIDDVELARGVLPLLGPVRAARVLADAVRIDDGPSRLLDVLRMVRGLRSELPDRLPHGLLELEALCAPLMPLDPRPHDPRPAGGVPPGDGAGEPPPPPQAGHLDRAQAVDEDAAAVGMIRAAFGDVVPAMHVRPEARTPEDAPPVGRPRPHSLVDFHYERELRVLDGYTSADGRLQFCLPRTTGELEMWARILDNCAGDYAQLVGERRTTLIGVRVVGRLSYLLEWRRPGEIRQLHSDRNRPVPRNDARAIAAALHAVGLIDRAAAARCIANNDEQLGATNRR